MRWIVEFLLGAAFWFVLIYVLSEVVDVRPGDRPPPLVFGGFLAVAITRVLTYMRRPDRRLAVFALVHLAAVVVGFGIGITLFPPDQAG